MDYLASHQDDEKYRYAMVGYIRQNTLTDNGYVARGVCETDENGYLTDIVERTRIRKRMAELPLQKTTGRPGIPFRWTASFP